MDIYNIVYDFSDVDYKYKEQVTFQNIVSGTFNICGRVLDASKIIGFDYSYSDKESTLTIKLDTSKWDFRLKKEVLFSYQLNVDDSSSCSGGGNYTEYSGNLTATAYINSSGNYWTVGSQCYTKILLDGTQNYVIPQGVSSGEASFIVYSDQLATPGNSVLLTASPSVAAGILGVTFLPSNITSTSFDLLITGTFQ